jgi:hypothetical protein
VRSNIALNPAALAVVQVALTRQCPLFRRTSGRRMERHYWASRILALAASGERDPIRLRSAALG